MRRIRMVVLAGMIGLAGCIPPSGGGGGDPQPTTGVPLDQANLAMTIAASGATALVQAILSTQQLEALEMTGGQWISVAGEELSGPTTVDGEFRYTATLAPADSYRIVVNEPTRGPRETVVNAPLAFEITSHEDGDDASLSGFTLTWSPTDGSDVRIRITQNGLNGEVEKLYEDVEDTGSFAVGVLSGFGSGGGLTMKIAVTKQLPQGVNGLANGVVSVERTVSVAVTPTP